MAQFTVYRNEDPRSKSTYPLLLDVQSDLLDELQTRVVIPLAKAASLAKRPMGRLTPTMQFAGEIYVLMTPQMAGIARGILGPPAGTLSAQRDAIVAAIDFLVLGF